MKIANRFGQIAKGFVGGAMLVGGLSVGPAAHASIMFTFDYSLNAPGVGFDDPTLGAGRKTALETAGTMFSDYFGTLFSNSASISMQVTSTNLPLPGTLATAGTERIYAPGVGNGEVVRNKLLSNGAVDLNGAASDGHVAVNWGAPWELDPNVMVSTTPHDDFDFYAAIFHEFTHALGFANIIQEGGSDAFSNGALKGGIDFDGTWNEFNRYLTDCGGNDLVNQGTLRTNLPVWDAAKDGGICFSGTNAVAANGGDDVIMYSAPGTRGSHLLDAGVTDNAMMEPFRNRNIDETRSYGAIEVGILTDLGYTRVVSTVPEPESAVLFLLGLVTLAVRKKLTRAGRT